MAKKKGNGFWYKITHVEHLSRGEYVSMVRNVTKFVALAFLCSFLVFVAIAILGGAGKVVSTIESSNLTLYALAFLFVLIGYLISFAKWDLYAKILGLKISAWKNLSVYLSLYAMDITPGRIGRIVAAYTLNRITKIRFIDIVPMVTMDIFTDFLGIAVFALAVSIYFNKFILFVLIADAILLLPFIFILNEWFLNLIKGFLKRHNRVETLEMFAVYGSRYFKSQSKLNKPKVYLLSLAFTLPGAFFSAMALYFVLLSLGAHPMVGTSTLTYSVSLLYGMITSIPGNLGVTDAVLVALLGSSFGISASLASAATIMTRIATLWFGVLLGGAFLFYTLRFWNPSKGWRSKKKKRK